MNHLSDRGVLAALGAAALFGAGTPLAKLLLGSVDPWLLAGLLYLGSGAGLTLMRLFRRAPSARPTGHEWGWLAGAIIAGGIVGRPTGHEWGWLAGAIIAGGIVGPVLLMFGLSAMPASGASLLLNAEGVFTALLAWFVFRENFDRRIALGMAAIVAGAVVLAWPGNAHFGDLWPSLAVLGACLAWAVDNNLARKVSLADATWIAACKGWAAGAVNFAIAATIFNRWPAWQTALAAGGVGWLAYGVSLSLFVVALRHLGTARTGAYFSVAPFVGALIAVALLGEPITLRLVIAGALMALGVWLHLTERHVHEHTHEALVHTHEHVHDEHHRHTHDFPVEPGTRHTHAHQHEPITHTHPHFPDAHHRHSH